jgi:Sec-independent protein translocase protein TatA
MFGVGPTELAFFLVIVLLAVGPERLPTFMRTVGKGMRQVRNASREFKEAIGFDELMREGDPFRSPPVRPPRARPLPVQEKQEEREEAPAALDDKTIPPPMPEAAKVASPPQSETDADDAEPVADPDASDEAKVP